LRAIRLAVGVAFAALAVGASPSLAFSELTTADEQLSRLAARADLITVGVNALQVQYYRDEGDQLADGTAIGEGTALGEAIAGGWVSATRTETGGDTPA